MSLNRIQKLLFSDYSDFEDMVLIESPFAEVTRQGVGLRQVQIGLTSSKLILAADIVHPVSEYPIYYYPGRIDPEIECMELISIFPIELVALSVFQRRRRKVLKARFHDGNPNHNIKVVYFELGGAHKRKMFWNLWCEKVRFLTPENQRGSSTEASVASSTSIGSVYLAKTRITGDKVWQYFASTTPRCIKVDNRGDLQRSALTAVDSDVRTIYRNQKGFTSSVSSMSTALSHLPPSATTKVNRFSEGVDERCATGLYLKNARADPRSAEVETQFKMFQETLGQCTALKEEIELKVHARRRYAFIPCPDLHSCFGVYSTDRAGAFNMQMKRSRSSINIKEERIVISDDDEITRNSKQLEISQSADKMGYRSISNQLEPNDQVLWFWTTDCWYRPDRVKRKIALYRAKKPELGLKKKRKLSFFKRKSDDYMWDLEKKEQPLIELENSFNFSPQLSIWDLDSTILAHQLTLIDSKLFLKIPITELKMMMMQGKGRNCKNFMTWLIFSHRVACLVATQILLTHDPKRRARLIARIINASEKCYLLSNHQSASSLLHGLQCPPIYRLCATWSHVRQYHSTPYSVLKKLCRYYRSPSLPDFSKVPYLPSANFLLDLLLGRLRTLSPDSCGDLSKEFPAKWQETHQLNESKHGNSSVPKIMHQLMSVFNLTPPGESSSTSSVEACLNEDDNIGIPLKPESGSYCCLNDVEELFKMSLQAARKYDFPSSQKEANDFLLKQPYQEYSTNFQLSLRIEPSN